MKRKLLISMMSAAVALSALPMTNINAKTMTIMSTQSDGEWDEESSGLDEGANVDDGSDEFSGEFTKYDIRTSPAKKTIKVGKTFYINVIPEDNSEWEDIPDEEWEELCEENIDGITFRSSNSSVASVNKKTGLVKAKKKGNAVIKTTINLANGETATYKTKVYVTK